MAVIGIMVLTAIAAVAIIAIVFGIARKIHEYPIRHDLSQIGYRVVRNWSNDRYVILDVRTNKLVIGMTNYGRYELTLEDVEYWIDQKRLGDHEITKDQHE